MRLLLKLTVIIVLGPVVLVLLLIAAAAAIIGIPLAWESLIARYTSPPNRDSEA
ncbi:MAG: hypothetical protein ACRDFX_04415 [Chloroflexota bacterium]